MACHAITGVIAPFKGKESKLKVALMGELDAVVCPGHRCADPVTGAAHSCGHNCMIAALSGVAYALKDTGIMEELSGDIVLMAVPAEEYVEIEYRNELKKAGKIWFLGGKQEFIYEGVFDDLFQEYTVSHTLERVKTTNMGTLYEIRYTVVLRDEKKIKAFLDDLRTRNGNLTIICGRVGTESAL